jgi:hypothetical protein
MDVKRIKHRVKWFCFHKHRGIIELTTFVMYNIVGYKIMSFIINNIVALSFIFDVHFFRIRPLNPFREGPPTRKVAGPGDPGSRWVPHPL